MKLVFMGTPEFSVPALEALVDAGHEVICAYTQPPRPAGRGKRDRPSAVHHKAEELGIAVRTPATLKDKDEQRALVALEAEAAVVVAYGLMLPQSILDALPLGCWNIHASLLPRWRGAAPIHRAVMAGDSETGISIMRMEAGLDTGPVILSTAMRIGAEDTTGALHDKLARLGAVMIAKALDALASLPEIPQSEDGVTYAKKIEKAEARVDWSRPATEVDRHIRGLSPFPGAWCEIDGERTKLLGSRLAEGNGEPGQHLGEFRIACGSGAVQVTEAQRQGKKPMSAAEILRGMTLPERLS